MAEEMFKFSCASETQWQNRHALHYFHSISSCKGVRQGVKTTLGALQQRSQAKWAIRPLRTIHWGSWTKSILVLSQAKHRVMRVQMNAGPQDWLSRQFRKRNRLLIFSAALIRRLATFRGYIINETSAPTLFSAWTNHLWATAQSHRRSHFAALSGAGAVTEHFYNPRHQQEGKQNKTKALSTTQPLKYEGPRC